MSDHAKTCPHCGSPVRGRIPNWQAGLLIALVILLIALAAGTADGADGLTNTLSTNYVPAPAHLRVVRGQWYDVTKSVRWSVKTGECLHATGHLAVFREFKVVLQYGQPRSLSASERRANQIGVGIGLPRAPIIGRDKVYGEVYAVTNTTSKAGSILVGADAALPLFHLGQTEYEGSLIQLYDMGLPHRWQVIVTNKPPKSR